MSQIDTLSLEWLVITGLIQERTLRWLTARESVTRLDGLIRLTREQVLAIDGMGPIRMRRLEATMAKHGLSFARDPGHAS
jgi:transcriptional regulator of aromatic amino acid metabolism